MSINWRVYGSSTVASLLDKSEFSGFFQNIVVGPNEAAVIIRDGKIERTITGTRKNTSGLWDNFKKLWGRSSELQVVFVDTSPIDLTFYVGASSRQESGSETGQFSQSREDVYKTIEERTRERSDTTELTISALTSDGQHVSAEVGVTLRLPIDDAQFITALLRGGTSIADWDIAALVRDELLAKAIVPIIGQHTGNEIRGNQDLATQISQSAETLLRTKFDLYGLELINMHVNWGLTEEDELAIAEGRKDREARAIEFDHTREIREQERELELERQRVSNLTELKKLESEGNVEEAEIILAGEINRENLVDGKRISQEKITAQVKEIELGIDQKEKLLEIEAEKAKADSQFAIEQRQTLFDQDMKQREEDRHQQTLNTQSQRELSEMQELSKMQADRQRDKRESEQETKRQSAEAELNILKAKLEQQKLDSQIDATTLDKAISKGFGTGEADASVLREMLKQRTDRVYSESNNMKAESQPESEQVDNSSESLHEQQNEEVEQQTNNITNHTCTSCSSPIQAGWIACPSCGTHVERLCTSCSSPVQGDWKVCPSCGTDIKRICKNCSSPMQVAWKVCPSCGLPNQS